MGSLPKPLIGLLLGTVAFFAVWMVALKPSSSSSNGGSQGGVGQYQPAINKAHQAVTTSNQANAKLGAPTATTSATSTPAKATSTPAKATQSSKPAAKPHAANKRAIELPETAPAPMVTELQDSLIHRDVLAVLFYNPAASDDQSMVKELEALPVGDNPVAKFPLPISWLTQFPMITTQVSVDTTPTLVIIDPQHHATTITGWASSREIAQRIDDALAVKPPAK